MVHTSVPVYSLVDPFSQCPPRRVLSQSPFPNAWALSQCPMQAGGPSLTVPSGQGSVTLPQPWPTCTDN